ncbi:MAG: ubiquinol-cytochrome c reductase iron-sulfur subunit [Gammaproteobacteria bacterium]|nr:MAG: ubiquinol-cytochrome c reductase iron-sulfur subunit [Gammaproteobacteria bacterium]
MGKDDVDKSKRRFLTVATSAVGAVGAGFVAVPFIKSMSPSERARAAGAPVVADFGYLEPGKMHIEEWRGKPVWVLRRTPEMLATLEKTRARLKDPDSNESEQPEYSTNNARSIKDEYLIVIGICTHLGCSPTFRPDAGGDIGEDWLGGYLCPCHGGLYDLAGRVYQNVPPPLNLVVPPHRYLSDTRVIIGEDGGVA